MNVEPSKRVDRILELLDVGEQHTSFAHQGFEHDIDRPIPGIDVPDIDPRIELLHDVMGRRAAGYLSTDDYRLGALMAEVDPHGQLHPAARANLARRRYRQVYDGNGQPLGLSIDLPTEALPWTAEQVAAIRIAAIRITEAFNVLGAGIAAVVDALAQAMRESFINHQHEQEQNNDTYRHMDP